MKHCLLICMLLLTGCTGLPAGVSPVSGFELDRYLGTWYEIARLDHRFERDMTHVTADYSMQADGGVRVVNRGFNAKEQEWQQADGKAYAVDDPTIGRLKVSFFGPFYGGYNIIALDVDNYRYSLVSGPNHSYLWILSRTQKLEEGILNRLLQVARELGFDTDKLIYVDHASNTIE
jgi:apolipoprotein D and lipocalin family protein